VDVDEAEGSFQAFVMMQ